MSSCQLGGLHGPLALSAGPCSRWHPGAGRPRRRHQRGHAWLRRHRTGGFTPFGEVDDVAEWVVGAALPGCLPKSRLCSQGSVSGGGGEPKPMRVSYQIQLVWVRVCPEMCPS